MVPGDLGTRRALNHSGTRALRALRHLDIGHIGHLEYLGTQESGNLALTALRHLSTGHSKHSNSGTRGHLRNLIGRHV